MTRTGKTSATSTDVEVRPTFIRREPPSLRAVVLELCAAKEEIARLRAELALARAAREA